MQLTVLVNDTDYSDAALLEQTRITKEISARVSTASVVFSITTPNTAVYDTATYDDALYSVGVAELNEIRLVDEFAVVQFAGLITKVTYQRHEDSDTEVLLACDCNDWTWLLDQVNIPSATFTGQTDRSIIQSLISTYAPQISALTGNIASLATIAEWEVKDKTLRQAIDELVELTGGEWRVDYEKAFRYFDTSVSAAPWGLSTSPDDSTTFAYKLANYSRDFTHPINRCTVLGGFLTGGIEISQTYNDTASQAEYGAHAWVIVDREIASNADALLKAQATVESSAYPKETGTVVLSKDGLDVGQSIAVFHEEFAIDGIYLIRSMELVWQTRSLVEYTIQFGDPPPSIERLLRLIEARARRATTPPKALPPAESVAVSNFATTLPGIYIVNAKPTDWSPYRSASLFVNTADGKLYRRDGDDWTAEVPTVDLTGPIETLQLANDAVTAAKIAASAVTTTKIADDSISTPKLIAGAVQTSKIAAGAVTTNELAALAVTAGKIAALAVEAGKIAANAVTAGTIAADAVTAGTIAAGAIRAIDAAFDTAAIQTADIANAAITGGKIANTTITASNIVDGTITGTKIASATITDSNLVNSTITGAKIANSTITGSNIVDATITNAKINDLAANKISAGTISASITMTSPTLVITSGTVTVNIDATNKIKVTDSALTRSTEMTGSHFRVGKTSDASNFCEIALDVVTVSGSGGATRADLTPTRLIIGGNQVVGTRMSAVTSPSGGATIDSQARTAIDAIRNVLSTHGLTA